MLTVIGADRCPNPWWIPIIVLDVTLSMITPVAFLSMTLQPTSVIGPIAAVSLTVGWALLGLVYVLAWQRVMDSLGEPGHWRRTAASFLAIAGSSGLLICAGLALGTFQRSPDYIDSIYTNASWPGIWLPDGPGRAIVVLLAALAAWWFSSAQRRSRAGMLATAEALEVPTAAAESVRTPTF